MVRESNENCTLFQASNQQNLCNLLLPVGGSCLLEVTVCNLINYLGNHTDDALVHKF